MSEQRFLDYDKSLACIHCGLCLSSCPTYLETGNENDSPRGRIYIMRAVQDGQLPLQATPVRHIDLCLGCRACEAVCPSGVHYGELLESTRDHIEKHHRRSLWQRALRRVAIEGIFPYPGRMRVAVWPTLLLRRMGLHKLLPKFLRDSIDLLPEHLSKNNIPQIVPASKERRGTVGFVSGCVMSVLFNETNAASISLLNAAGFDVVTPFSQGCCGALFGHSGQLEKARDCARQNIEAFERLSVEAIIINAAGCGSTLKEYAHLIHEDPAFAERARQFAAKVIDLTEFLATHPFRRSASDSRSLGEGTGVSGKEPPGSDDHSLGSFRGKTVTYHDACHLAHAQRVTKAPRQLLKSDASISFVELPESDVCCGSAGSYNLTEPEMAERLQQRKVENILKSGAKVVVTTNPGCILQIQAGLKKAGATGIQVLHIADFLCASGNFGNE